MQATGLFGRRAQSLPLAEALDLLARGLRGRRRQREVWHRVNVLLHGLAACLPGIYPPDPATVADVLGRVVATDPAQRGAAEPAVFALALFGAEPELIDRVGVWLGGEAGRQLCELGRAERGAPVFAVVDLETLPDGSVRELAIVRARSGRVLGRLAMQGPIDPGRVSAWLVGSIVVAHNGADHDFPVLERLGATVPGDRLDTLRWAWLAFPTHPGHALADVCEALGVEIHGERHTAAYDAEILAAAAPRLLAVVRVLAPTTRRRLGELLTGHVSPAVLGQALGDWSHQPLGDGGELRNGVAAWRRSDRQPAATKVRVVEACPDLQRWRPREDDQLVVVREISRWADVFTGRWAAGDRLIDPTALAASGNLGWPAAVALRVVEAGHGMLACWPPSARQLADSVPRRPAGPYVLGGGPWLTDPESVAAAPPDRPVALVDAVDLLLSGVDPRFDPASANVPVTAIVTHPGPRRNEMTRFWELALGGAVSFRGDQRSFAAPVAVVQGVPLGASTPVAAGRVTAVAAGRSEHGSTILVTNGDRRDLVVHALARAWKNRTGRSLLRPPHWPTVVEATRRLREAPHLAVATPGTASRLASSGAEMVLDRVGAPSTDNPVVARMLEGCEDAYGDVVEPAAALRLLRLICHAAGPVWVCDPVGDSPLMRAALSSTTSSRRRIDELESSDLARWATDHILATISATAENDDAPRAHVTWAVGRLLGNGRSLRQEQRTVIESVLTGHDVIGVFRTGLGKSLCYQAAGLALAASGRGATLVVSPLMALQRDQVRALRARRVWEATLLNSALDPSVRGSRLRGIAAGFYRLVYVAPEGLHSDGLRSALGTAGLALVAVDEAHCISELGHDFRPDYRTIPVALRRALGLRDDQSLYALPNRPRMLALTGTASPATRHDIMGQLDGQFRTHVDSTFVREELRFAVRRIGETPGRSGRIVDDHPARWVTLLDVLASTETPAIIYAPTRADTEQLARLVGDARGVVVDHYHAGLEGADRERVETSFKRGDIDIVVATNAFGMGVDKADVRAVVHWRMPSSPEALYQEAGRAGRGLPEGEHADCVVLYHPEDLDQAARIGARNVPSARELTWAWATIEELHRQQGAPGHVVVSDVDLAQLAGLRPSVDPAVVIAHLQRVGLVVEGERRPPEIQVIAKGVELPVDLPPTEQAVAQLLPHGRDPTAISPAAVAEWLAIAGIPTTPSDVRAAVRHLVTVGYLEVAPPTVHVRALAVDPAVVVAAGWADARKVARSLPPTDWCTPTPKETGVPVDRLVQAVEVLAAMGCVVVAQRPHDGGLPRVKRSGRPFDSLRPIASIAPAIVGAATAADGGLNDLPALASAHGVEPDQARDALLSGHLFTAISLDPRRWEESDARPSAGRRLVSNGTCRLLRVNPGDVDLAAAIEEAAAAARERSYSDDLRRRALHRYASIEDEESAGEARQRYLERYFTEPGFLDDLRADTVSGILAGLDPEQFAAVRVEAQRVVIRAGAGTGKTRTVTRRIAYRAATGRVMPGEVVAVCFGRDPAAEMSARLAGLGVTGVRVSTLNALGSRVLRDFWPKLGRPAEPTLVDEREARRWITEAVRRSDLDPKRINVLQQIALAKALLQRPGELSGSSDVPAEKLNAVYRGYEGWLAEQNRIDFADQILLAVDLLQRSEVSEQVCGSIREVYVDEAQDLSPAQWALVEAIATEATLTVVGDPRQAIYAWNGADPAVFDALAARPDGSTVDLVRNYRSRASLLEAPNRVMRRYPALTAWDERPADSTALRCAGPAEHDSAVVEVVRGWLDEGVADDEIAVLARSNEQVDRITRRLSRERIAVRALGLPPIHRTAAYAIAQRLLLGEHDPDSEDLATAMDRLAARPEVQDAVLGSAAPGPDVDPWSDWHRLTADLSDQERKGVADPSDALLALAREAGPTVAHGGVVVATIHKAKGLEWEAVVFAEATADSFADSVDNRCLAYVALTRARTRRRVVAHDNGDGLAPMLRA